MKEGIEQECGAVRLDEALRALPRTEASTDFVAAVLARAARATERRRTKVRRRASLIASAAFLLVASVFWNQHLAHRQAERRAALVDEHRRLVQDFDDLRALAERRTQIRLGGDATTDLFLDLAALPAVAQPTPSLNATRSRS
ncbi:MAG: hypothetical protein ABI639_16010 [Thermoanaerobaculia bacterium]